MGTLKTTINLKSDDVLPFKVDQTNSTNSLTGNFIETGRKLIKTFTEEFFNSGDGFLARRDFGPNGAYMMVNNPSTNSETIKLYGLQQVTEELAESTLEGIESFATLRPGDSILVTLTPQQNGVFAATTFGTATVEYFIADRGGNFGESGFFIDNTGPTFKYVVLDSQLAEVLPSSYPTPYWSGKDLGIATSAFTIDNNTKTIVHNKGYVFGLQDVLDPIHYIWVFINDRGEFYTYETNLISNITDLDQNGFAILTDDGIGNLILKYFDGHSLFTHAFVGTWFSPFPWNYDATTFDGSFILIIEDYLGNPGDRATILINKEKSYVLEIMNTSNNIDVVPVLYSYGSFLFQTFYDNNSYKYTKFQIWSTNGVLLHEINVSDYNFNNLDYVFYGDNKLQIIYRDGNYDYLLNYNGITNKLIGYDTRINQLSITHENNGNYSYRRIYAYPKYLTNSIRPWYYSWNSGLFDANSIAIVYSDNMDNIGGYHINSQVFYCDMVYMLDDQTHFTTYKFADGETKYIRLPYTSGEYRITPSSNLIAFTYGVSGYTDGPLNVLTITKEGVESAKLINNLADVDNGYNQIVVKPVGEYIMYGFYYFGNNTTTVYMVKKASVKDSFTTLGYVLYNYYYRVNSLVIYGDSEPKLWYFNTVNNKFTEITNGYNDYIDILYNNSTTVDGLNDGNILFYPSDLSTGSATLILLKKGVLTKAVPTPTTDGSWNLYLGSEAVFLIYQDMDDYYKYKVNVYNFDLKLIRTVPLLTTNYEYVIVTGKRAYIRTYDADQLGVDSLYSYYMISLNGVAYWTNPNYIDYQFDDKYWWEYIY